MTASIAPVLEKRTGDESAHDEEVNDDLSSLIHLFHDTDRIREGTCTPTRLQHFFASFLKRSPRFFAIRDASPTEPPATPQPMTLSNSTLQAKSVLAGSKTAEAALSFCGPPPLAQVSEVHARRFSQKDLDGAKAGTSESTKRMS